MRVGSGVELKPIKYIHGFERTSPAQTIQLRVARSRGDSLGALVEHVDVVRTGMNDVQAEPTDKTETIQHLRSFGQTGHQSVIHLLVQIQTGFVPAKHIDFELQAVEVNLHWPVKFST